MSKSKKSDKTPEADKAGNEPKRHIVLPGKRKVVGVENISDNSEDYDQINDLPPFSVDVDPSILLSKEDTPYLRRDHALVKRKIINVPVDNDNE